MMTTEAPRSSTRSTAPVASRGALVGGVAWLVVATAVLLLVAALAADGRAVLGALAGSALVLVTFAFGAAVVGAAAKVLPSAALLVALLTYTLQLLALLLVFVAFHESADAQARISGDWLGGGMVVATLAWITGQLLATLRTPVEPWVPAGESDGEEASA